MAEIISTVGSGLDFADLTTAEAAADDVAGDHKFECKGDVGQFASISGWQAGSSLVIRPMRGEKHDGKTAISGAHVSCTSIMTLSNANPLSVKFQDMGFINTVQDEYVRCISYTVVQAVAYEISGCLFDLLYSSQVTTTNPNYIFFDFTAVGETINISRNRIRFVDQGNSSTVAITFFRWNTLGTRFVTCNNNTFDTDTDSSASPGINLIFNGSCDNTTIYNNVSINQDVDIEIHVASFVSIDDGNNLYGGGVVSPSWDNSITSSDFENLAGFDYTPTRDGLLFQAGEDSQAQTPDIVGQYVPQGNRSDVGAFERKRDQGARTRGNSNGRVLIRPGWRRP